MISNRGSFGSTTARIQRPPAGARAACARLGGQSRGGAGGLRGGDPGASARRATGRRPVAARRGPRSARSGAGPLNRDRRAAPARHHPQGARRACSTRGCRSSGIAGMDAGRRAPPRCCFSTRPTTPPSILRCGGASRARRARRSRRWSTGSCATSRASDRRSSMAPIRSTTIRRPGSPSAGAPTTARDLARAIAPANRDEPTLDLSVKSDAEGWARRLGGVVLPTGSVRLETHARSPNSKATRKANGGCRTRRRAAGAFAATAPGLARRRSLRRAGRQGRRNRADRRAKSRRSTAPPNGSKRWRPISTGCGCNAEIAVADALSFEAPPFDAVLLDAPCTRDRHDPPPPRRRLDQAARRPAPLAALQAQLLDKAVALTKPGGLLVYCTCSLEPEEGEAQIAALTAPQSRRPAGGRSRPRRSAA